MAFLSPLFFSTMVQYASLKKNNNHVYTNVNDFQGIVKGKTTIFLLLEFRLFTASCYYKQCCSE